MKKIFLMPVVTVLMLAAITVPTFAHSHGTKTASQSTYTLCSVENCSNSGYHNHNGTTYSGHYNGDGHGHNNHSAVNRSAHGNGRHH